MTSRVTSEGRAIHLHHSCKREIHRKESETKRDLQLGTEHSTRVSPLSSHWGRRALMPTHSNANLQASSVQPCGHYTTLLISSCAVLWIQKPFPLHSRPQKWEFIISPLIESLCHFTSATKACVLCFLYLSGISYFGLTCRKATLLLHAIFLLLLWCFSYCV